MNINVASLSSVNCLIYINNNMRFKLLFTESILSYYLEDISYLLHTNSNVHTWHIDNMRNGNKISGWNMMRDYYDYLSFIHSDFGTHILFFFSFIFLLTNETEYTHNNSFSCSSTHLIYVDNVWIKATVSNIIW